MGLGDDALGVLVLWGGVVETGARKLGGVREPKNIDCCKLLVMEARTCFITAVA